MRSKAGVWVAFYFPAALIDLALYANLFALQQRAMERGAGPAGLARLVATYIGVYVLSSLVVGRLRARGPLLAATSAALAGLFALGTATGALWQFQATLGAIGVFSAVFWTSTQARLGEEAGPNLGGAIGGFNLAWSAGKALGLFSAGPLYQWDARAPFVLAAACAAGACACNSIAEFWNHRTRRIRRNDERALSASSASSAVTLVVPQARKRRFLIAALTANFLGYGVNAMAIALVPDLGRTIGLSPALQSACLAVTVGGQLAGFALLGRSRAWTYRAAPLVGVELVFAAAGATLALAPSWPLLLPGLFVFGAAQSITYASSLFYSLDYDERRQMRAGIHEAMLGVGGFAIPLLGGALAARPGGIRDPYWLAAGMVATAAVAHAAALGLSRLRTSAVPRT